MLSRAPLLFGVPYEIKNNLFQFHTKRKVTFKLLSAAGMIYFAGHNFPALANLHMTSVHHH
jgi:hypothetical protein